MARSGHAKGLAKNYRLTLRRHYMWPVCRCCHCRAKVKKWKAVFRRQERRRAKQNLMRDDPSSA